MGELRYGRYGGERERSYRATNFDYYDPWQAAGEYQMPGSLTENDGAGLAAGFFPAGAFLAAGAALAGALGRAAEAGFFGVFFMAILGAVCRCVRRRGGYGSFGQEGRNGREV